jgi:hypothetical protein
VARSGERLTIESVIARNLTREIEVYLPLSYVFYAIGNSGGDDPLLGWLAAGLAAAVPAFPFVQQGPAAHRRPAGRHLGRQHP